MTPEQAIDRLTVVPYAAGLGAWTGGDCWGVVELWYRHVVGVELDDRADMPPGNRSVSRWFGAQDDWSPIERPADHCLVIMRVGRLSAGHIGIFWGGSVLHSSEHHGCVYQPISDPRIRSSITSFLARK